MWGVGVLTLVVVIVVGVGVLGFTLGGLGEVESGVESFECGFESMSSARSAFSIKFYLIITIFLVFDAEIMIVLPMPSALGVGLGSELGYVSCLVWWILIWGVVIEWWGGCFEWVS